LSSATGLYGTYGGRYVPETLIPALDQLEAGWRNARVDDSFQAELDELGRTFAGRPTPLTRVRICCTRARTS
jgi:tryptophan synthase beta chain